MSSIDAGDSYRTPGGRRVLRRAAGVMAVHASSAAETNRLIQALTRAGGALEGQEARPDTDGWVLFNANAAARSRQMESHAVLADDIKRVRGKVREVVNPVYVDPDSGLRLVVTEGLVICLKPGVEAADYFGAQGGTAHALPGAANQFVLKLPGLSAEQILAEVDSRMEDSRVAWAEPDFLMEVSRQYMPNDTYFPQQWHLNNTGQAGGLVDADVDATEAWETTRGSSNVVIAVIDDGVQMTHPDLSANIFTNAAELANGVDDDNNGYLNDYAGWDFYFGDNNANPFNAADVHGTTCAGVAAAVGDNGLGVCGVAYGCKILSVKVFDGDFLASSTSLANAIRYAAGLTSPQPWRGADVISISLLFTKTAAIDSALDDAAINGRGGKGCPIFVASGNGASGFQFYGIDTTGLSAGTYEIEFEYYKDPLSVAGDDRVWLGDVFLPDISQSWVRFDSLSLPAGWSTYGNASWTAVDDPVHTYGSGRYALRSGTIGNSQYTTLVTSSFVLSPGATLYFDAWVSSEKGTDSDASISYPPNGDDGDLLWVHFYNVTAGAYVGSIWIDSGVPGNRRWYSGEAVSTGISYPASYTNTIAVGACTDFAYRSDYSQYGAGLDVVTPSGGGWAYIYTTDRTGADGYVSGDFEPNFNGTSSSTPLAAGIGALILSKNPSLTMSEVRSIVRKSCDKIGAVTYAGGISGAGGTNTYYGYGRLNANLALQNTPVLSSPTLNAVYNPTNGTLQLSWNNTYFHLQAQTNGLASGLSSQWYDHPAGSTSPVTVTNSPAAPAVFYRLAWP